MWGNLLNAGKFVEPLYPTKSKKRKIGAPRVTLFLRKRERLSIQNMKGDGYLFKT
jgi:hypothetical protein